MGLRYDVGRTRQRKDWLRAKITPVAGPAKTFGYIISDRIV
jgi:hypothetical protein